MEKSLELNDQSTHSTPNTARRRRAHEHESGLIFVPLIGVLSHIWQVALVVQLVHRLQHHRLSALCVRMSSTSSFLGVRSRSRSRVEAAACAPHVERFEPQHSNAQPEAVLPEQVVQEVVHAVRAEACRWREAQPHVTDDGVRLV